MKITLALAAPALLFAGTALAAPKDVPYKAVGTEPGWTLTIGNGQIRYVGDYGRTRITTRAPQARPSFNGERYVTPRITVDITHARCNDGMSDRAYRDRVMVTVGRKTVRGCGGDPILATPSLTDTNWRIVAIDGRPLTLDRPTSLRFSEDHVQGRAGCNSFGGGYKIVRDLLITSEIISTKMACPGPGMATENRFFQIVAHPLRLKWEKQDGLTLLNKEGSVSLKRAIAR